MLPAYLWRPGPLRLLILLVGLWLFGTGEACIVAAELGNSPWTVLAQGVAEHTPLEIGAATVVISLLVLAAWIPLRQPPGLGTVLNAIVVGVAIGVMVNLLPADPGPAVAWPLLAGGIGLVGLGGGVYLGARPPDGLMTGLRPHRALATANAHDHRAHSAARRLRPRRHGRDRHRGLRSADRPGG